MTKSPTKNSTELLDRYLQAVRFWLPRAQQQDIIAELSEDLHAQIEDEENELGHPLDDAELEVILRRCGSPILVASRYRPQTHLIGPALFPIYQFVLKLVLAWILVPVFLVVIGPAIILPAADRTGALVETVSTLWITLFVAAGIITVIFALVERSHDRYRLLEKWSLRSLPPAPKPEETPSRTQSVFGLLFGIVGILWLVAIPAYPLLILGPAAAFLQPAPMWHTFYLPMIFLAIAGMAHQCISLARPRWTWLPTAARLLTIALSLVIVNFMIESALQTTNDQWHPFVVLASSVPSTPQHERAASIVNVCILISLASVWLGLCVAGVVRTWQLLREIRKRSPRPRDPALLRSL